MKCCPKLHIKQLRNNLHYICLWDRVGLEGGSQMKRGGVQEKGGSGPPDPPPHLDTPMKLYLTLNIMELKSVNYHQYFLVV